MRENVEASNVVYIDRRVAEYFYALRYYFGSYHSAAFYNLFHLGIALFNTATTLLDKLPAEDSGRSAPTTVVFLIHCI